MEKIKLSTGRKRDATYPNQIRYLLVVSFVANNKDNFKKHIDNPAFYDECISTLRSWLTMSDGELKSKFPSLPFLSD